MNIAKYVGHFLRNYNNYNRLLDTVTFAINNTLGSDLIDSQGYKHDAFWFSGLYFGTKHRDVDEAHFY